MTKIELRRQVAGVRRGDRLCFVSVVPSLSTLLRKLAKKKGILLKEVKLSDLRLRTPYTVNFGIDRAMNVFSAKRFFPNSSFVILDFGTATTIEFFHKKRGYLGGWIAPGIDILLDALALRTAKLPRISFKPSLRARPGKNTVDSMSVAATAICQGFIAETLGFASKTFRGSYRVILTGGGATKMRPLLRRQSKKYYHIPDLILRGLKELC